MRELDMDVRWQIIGNGVRVLTLTEWNRLTAVVISAAADECIRHLLQESTPVPFLVNMQDVTKIEPGPLAMVRLAYPLYSSQMMSVSVVIIPSSVHRRFNWIVTAANVLSGGRIYCCSTLQEAIDYILQQPSTGAASILH